MDKDVKLTSREKDVLNSLTRGKSNKQIAVALNISEKTVETHLNHIYRKLNVKCRCEAISLYFTKIRDIPD